MMIRRWSGVIVGTLLGACLFVKAGEGASKNELLVWDMDWSQGEPGSVPRGADKAELEQQAANPLAALPIKSIAHVDYLTRTRTAMIQDRLWDYPGRTLEFTMLEAGQPNYGPRLSLRVPGKGIIPKQPCRWRLEMDVAAGQVEKTGGVSIDRIFELRFFEDGTARANQVVLGRYVARQWQHYSLLVDEAARTVVVRIDDGEPMTLAWRDPEWKGRFAGLRLDGLLPGGHARVGKIGFGAIRLWRIDP